MQSKLTSLKGNVTKGVHAWGKSFLVLLAASFRVHVILFVVVGFYLVGLEFLKHVTGISHTVSIVDWLWNFIGNLVVPGAFASVLAVRFLHMVIYIRPQRPTIYLVNDVMSILLSPKRLANGIPVLIALAVLIDTFSFIKNTIPYANPFSWDKTFMELDRILHFGHDPWKLVHPILSHWPVTLGLNAAYILWFFILWGVTLWIVFAKKNSLLRLQYLLAFFLCWIVGGSLLAVIFSSAGPVYYGHVVDGSNPYFPLVKYLRDTSEYVELWVVNTQDMLWQSYEKGGSKVGLGISAMPSMHVATTMLMAILALHFGRKAAVAGELYALIIFLGSIHLGWHYAVDSYMGIAIALLLWWISGYIIRWYVRFSFVPHFKDEKVGERSA